ncbi:signal transduction histidine kinase [Nocardiopsis sp. Huas11]|uniref:sensor histidine kinase n=1 Tax=Nocardiopsis sp. Huas11 TaxID=2183912 RepID=UPI000EB2FC34|nr:sensor domain-containing protein [Nocardiopsis sp. Huas11]RKS05067.1 signal transduction histidine kinase [Nocardiopsis sp. Huas11]
MPTLARDRGPARPAADQAAPSVPPPGGEGFWRAAARRPFLVLASAWPWRALAYLATSAPVALAWVLLCWPLLLLSGLPLGAVERRRLRLMGSAPAPSPHAPSPGALGSPAWVRARLHETATWRELAYGLLLLPLALAEAVAVTLLVAVPLSLLAAPLLRATDALEPAEVAALAGTRLLPAMPWAADLALGLLALPVSAYLAMALAAGRARLARLMVTADREEELDDRLGEVVRSRSRIVDAFTSERRRIERDLHDGAQQRLTSVIMRLGMARSRFEADPGQARALVDQAYEDARLTLSELRDLVHGIHPAVLDERGLAAALEELADACPVPASLDAEGAAPVPPAVASTAYFCAAEALANAVRHARPTEITLYLRTSTGPRGRVLLRVGDDGVGGADPRAGTGLTGLADRAAALEGLVRLSSPPGGPTVVEVEIPCAS